MGAGVLLFLGLTCFGFSLQIEGETLGYVDPKSEQWSPVSVQESRTRRQVGSCNAQITQIQQDTQQIRVHLSSLLHDLTQVRNFAEQSHQGDTLCETRLSSLEKILEKMKEQLAECSHSGSCSTFTQAEDVGAQLASSCDHLGGGAGYDLHSCMRTTCTHGGNTFNYHPIDKKCYFKRCTGQDLMLKRHTEGYEVFTNLSPRPCSSFTLTEDAGSQLASSCDHLGGGADYSFHSCMRTTCAQGGNTFNYHPIDKKCYFKRCAGHDLQLRRHTEGYEVFTNIKPRFCSPFTQAEDGGSQLASSCDHLGGGADYSLHSCMRATCAHGGNTFNYHPIDKKCYFKRCAGQDLRLIRHTEGYEVFTNLIPRPCPVFTLVAKSVAAKVTSCDHLGGGAGYDLHSCMRMTCAQGGNTFNYHSKDKKCYLKRCPDLDLMLMNNSEGYQVFTNLKIEL